MKAIASHREGVAARWRRAGAAAAVLVLPVTGAAITAAPASAAVRYMVTRTIRVGDDPWGVAGDSAAGLAPDSRDTQFVRGLIAWALKDYAAAERLFQALHQQSPQAQRRDQRLRIDRSYS